jgi:CubicO group peptidase (beta-lactamase class C family)
MLKCTVGILAFCLSSVPFCGKADQAEIIKKIVARCKETHTDAAQIYQNGQLILNYQSDHHYAEMEINSVTKSFVSLAIGFLLTEKKIQSIDTPVYTYFPEMNTESKKTITLRHILSHISGIQSNEESPEVGQAFDVVKLAVTSPQADPPGTRFQYNSKAVNILSGIVKQVSGMQPDEYLDQKLFKPLGISHWAWRRDPSGNAFANGGIQMDAESLSKVGLLLLNDGVWQGQRLLAHEWIQVLFLPSQKLALDYSLLWWLVGRGTSSTGTSAILARGYLGQQLVISPQRRIVGVRLIHQESASNAGNDHDFDDFSDLLVNL